MPTFLELVNDLRRECSVSGSAVSTVVGQTGEYLRLVNWINQAHAEIQGKYFDWKFLRATAQFTTAVGVETVPAPSDLNTWDMTRFYQGTDQICAKEWIDYRPNTAASGKPSDIFIRYDNDLHLYPNPDDAYVYDYEYFKTPLVMAVDSDEPLIPAHLQRVIVYRAMIMYANYEEAPELKAQAGELFGEAMRQLSNHQLSNKSQFYGRSETDLFTVEVQ